MSNYQQYHQFLSSNDQSPIKFLILAITKKMGGNHQHNGKKNLRIAFILNLLFTICEFIGGFWVNSVSIMSDAVHDLGDTMSLGLALYLEKKSEKKADEKYSFGYHRFSLLAALINSFVLIVGSIFIVQEAVQRIMVPESANALGMMYFAIGGVAINGYAAWKLSGGRSMNEKVVTWHLVEDVLGWVAVLIVSIVLQFEDYPILDPILSLAITAFILWGVLRRLKETLVLFLQGVPKNVDIDSIKSEILEIAKVDSIHETHIWSLEGNHHVFSTHVRLMNIENPSDVFQVKNAIKKVLKAYDFHHVTIETELIGESCEFELHDQ